MEFHESRSLLNNPLDPYDARAAVLPQIFNKFATADSPPSGQKYRPRESLTLKHALFGLYGRVVHADAQLTDVRTDIEGA